MGSFCAGGVAGLVNMAWGEVGVKRKRKNNLGVGRGGAGSSGSGGSRAGRCGWADRWMAMAVTARAQPPCTGRGAGVRADRPSDPTHAPGPYRANMAETIPPSLAIGPSPSTSALDHNLPDPESTPGAKVTLSPESPPSPIHRL